MATGLWDPVLSLSGVGPLRESTHSDLRVPFSPLPSKRDTSPRVKVLRVARNVDMSDAIPRLDAGLGRFSYTAGSKDTSQDLLCLIHLLWCSGISSLHSGGINSDNGSNSARWCAYDLIQGYTKPQLWGWIITSLCTSYNLSMQQTRGESSIEPSAEFEN